MIKLKQYSYFKTLSVALFVIGCGFTALFQTVDAQTVAESLKTTHSPDGQWTATIDETTGSLTLTNSYDRQVEVFPEGSTIEQVIWSPDSQRLLAVRANWRSARSIISGTAPIELWRLDFDVQNHTVSTPTLLYKPAANDYVDDPMHPQQVVFSSWSPNNRHLLFGITILSASVLADGIPPLVLDTDTGQIYSVGQESSPDEKFLLMWGRNNTALLNPRYHSWSPDGTKLTITAGGYRSAQINKWLNIFDITANQVTTVISKSEQIPGVVAWSPQGDLIAYAAVSADLTGDEWADQSDFDNPAIAGRRVYLLDPTTGESRRLNESEVYQDAPVWNDDGTHLYYVQREGNELKLMRTDLATGEAEAVLGAAEPLELPDSILPHVGYYGQFGRETLLEFIK